jgi:hypothetical protein
MIPFVYLLEKKYTYILASHFDVPVHGCILQIAFGMEMNNVENWTEKSEFTEAIILSFKGLSESFRDPFIQVRHTTE